MSKVVSDLEQHVLRPTAAETKARVLFYTFRDHPMFHLEDRYKLLALEELGVNPTVVRDPDEVLQAKDFDFIFTTLVEGTFNGREGLTPALADLRGLPCLGACSTVRAVSEDKVLGKAMAALHGLDVPRHRIVNGNIAGVSSLPMPGRWVMKPRYGTLSEFITYGDSPAAWRKAVQRSTHPMHRGLDFLAEEFVPGLNLAVPLIEGLPADSLNCFLETTDNELNILTNSGKIGQTRDYESEYYDGPGAAEARAAAARFAEAISPYDYARIDFRYEPVTGRLVFLEVNMSCAIGPYSVVARSAARHGIDHTTLIGHVFTHSLRRQRKAA
jgi:D-alanine-D-alanine ligase